MELKFNARIYQDENKVWKQDTIPRENAVLMLTALVRESSGKKLRGVAEDLVQQVHTLMREMEHYTTLVEELREQVALHKQLARERDPGE